MEVNVAGWIARSCANGPGERFVLWVQGCPLACPGCWAPYTWDFASRRLMTVDSLEAEIVAASGIRRDSLLGGGPLFRRKRWRILLAAHGGVAWVWSCSLDTSYESYGRRLRALCSPRWISSSQVASSASSAT